MADYLDGQTKKKVRIVASVPIVTLPVPIIGTSDGISITVDQIKECLNHAAMVFEYVGTSQIRLDLANYNTDNTVKEEVVTPVAKQTQQDISAAQAAAQAALDAAEAKKEADAKAAADAAAKVTVQATQTSTQTATDSKK